jgi:hypothetical protein
VEVEDHEGSFDAAGRISPKRVGSRRGAPTAPAG